MLSMPPVESADMCMHHLHTYIHMYIRVINTDDSGKMLSMPPVVSADMYAPFTFIHTYVHTAGKGVINTDDCGIMLSMPPVEIADMCAPFASGKGTWRVE